MTGKRVTQTPVLGALAYCTVTTPTYIRNSFLPNKILIQGIDSQPSKLKHQCPFVKSSTPLEIITQTIMMRTFRTTYQHIMYTDEHSYYENMSEK